MIKGRMHTKDGKPILFLGLSYENLDRLRAGDPIFVRPEESARHLLPEMGVVIHGGETEETILDQFSEAGFEAHLAPEAAAALAEDRDGLGTD
jgi:hypothetical protein